MLAALLTGCADKDAEKDADHAAPEWTYENVDAWGETCATGDEQSPIDLVEAQDADLPDPELDYRPATATVADTGHSVQVAFADGGTMALDGETYTLRQFHMHTPSEHHVDGSSYAAELHLVHENADGELAVLGVLVDEGEPDPLLGDVLEALPAGEAGPVELDEPVDVDELLPDDLTTYRYDGSLTTPPCTEGVSWLVLTTPVTWSAEQIDDLAGRHPDSHRPVQPHGDRTLTVDID